MAGQRAKELGIRKVLGATLSQLTGLLSKDFLRLVLIAILIAALTVSFQALKAAFANPINSLKAE